MSVQCAVLLLTIGTILVGADDLIVRIRQGLISGTQSNDGSYDKFEGIPYAKPPLGKRRFKAPLPPAHWNGLFYANRSNIQCPQVDRFASQVVGSEDCLVLNVYRQKRDHDATMKQAVMVFIHGGGFIYGSGGTYGAELLVKQDVVVVTINYRLTSLGFLCLGTEEIPGNAGLKDQRAALRWVKDNINAFGGDANSITIFGESAGALSVELHTLSDSSQGLFHKAIAQSGSAIAEWGLDRDPCKRVCEIAKNLGMCSCDDDNLTKFYQNVDFVRLILASALYDATFPVVSAYVCVEDLPEAAEPFLTDYPANLIKLGSEHSVPFLYGFNNAEGLIDIYEVPNIFNKLNQNFSILLPRDLCFKSEECKTKVSDVVRQYYFGDKEITNQTLAQAVDYFTDVQFLSSMVRSLEARVNISDAPSYFYEFCYEGQRNLKNYLGYIGAEASHSDELAYLFNVKGFSFPIPISADDQVMINRMTTMWTNFAKFGDPTLGPDALLPVKWIPAYSSSLETFIINLNMSMEQRPFPERIAFWDIIYSNYYCDSN